MGLPPLGAIMIAHCLVSFGEMASGRLSDCREPSSPATDQTRSRASLSDAIYKTNLEQAVLREIRDPATLLCFGCQSFGRRNSSANEQPAISYRKSMTISNLPREWFLGAGVQAPGSRRLNRFPSRQSIHLARHPAPKATITVGLNDRSKYPLVAKAF